MRNSALDVDRLTNPDSVTAGIQEAIDALPEHGGTVFLPAGTYLLRRSVRLRPKVTLRGEGSATVLTRPRERSIRLARRTQKNRTTVALTTAAGLRVGDEVYVRDDTQAGYYSRHGIVRAIRKSVIGLELLECDPERTYSPVRNAYLSNLFPALWIPRADEVTIESLTIDGGLKKHGRRGGDFTCAGIHARISHDLRIRDVTVRNWPSDGIGVQNGSATVSGCLTDNCRGPGLHPGTGLTFSSWTSNVARSNTGDGFYFCLGVVNAVVQGNLFHRNRRNGLGGLAEPDRCNAVTGNVCAENGEHGIEATRALGNSIQGNICRNNSQREPGKFAGIYLAEHRDNVVTGNVCIDDQEEPTQLKGIESIRPVGHNVITRNHSFP